MLKKTIDDIKTWFTSYTNSFYGVDADIDTNIRMKVLHTFKVAQEISELAVDLRLSRQESDIAVIIGLLHDCGRFEQIVKYRTFKDHESEDHALIGLRVIEEHSLLYDLSKSDKVCIKEAIKWHSAMYVEEDTNRPKDADMYIKMIRDADKIDIFRVVQSSYEDYLRNPQKANNMAINFCQDTGKCSPSVFKDVLERHQVSHLNVNTLEDRKLLQLCWVYDINYPQSLRRLLSRNYINLIFDALAPTEQMEQVKDAIRGYVKEILPDYK